MQCRVLATENLAGLEWVENPDVQLPEIRFVSRGDDQLDKRVQSRQSWRPLATRRVFSSQFLRFVSSLPLFRLCLLAAKSTR
jgi:hypothetical protein